MSKTAASTKWSWTKNAKEMSVSERRCTHCNQMLTGKVVMLERNWNTGTYSDGGVPEEKSQGWFPFGTDCAKRLTQSQAVA